MIPRAPGRAGPLLFGGRFDFQYDHILPVALGGATTVGNVQLLCADCNRRKSDNL